MPCGADPMQARRPQGERDAWVTRMGRGERVHRRLQLCRRVRRRRRTAREGEGSDGRDDEAQHAKILESGRAGPVHR